MKIGVIPIANIKKHQGQYLSIHFLTIGVPLYPIKALFIVDHEQGYKVPLRWQDILHAYSRYFFIIAGLGSTVIGNNTFRFEPHKNVFLYWLFMIMGYALIGLSLYSWIGYGRPSVREKKIRAILGSILPINMLPEYLSPELQQSLFSRLQLIAQQKGVTNWKMQVLNGQIEPEHKNVLFALAHYYTVLQPGPEAEKLLAKATH